MEVQLNKYKVLCETKAKEIKKLRDQMARLKRKELKRSGDTDDVLTTADEPMTANVNKKFLV